MRDLNKLMITGRLASNPAVRRTPQGSTVASFRVASNHTWRTADGRLQQHTEWVDVVAWNRLAEICGASLRSGSHVYIEGRLQTHAWVDQASREPRRRVELIASDVIILNAQSPADDAADDALPV